MRRNALARVARLAAASGALAATPFVPSARTLAQVPADESWRTIRTQHFDVHFTPVLDSVARRTAAAAELAYGNLASELVPPRGRVQIVVSDGADASNGSATMFPRNTVIVLAKPPVDVPSLRGYGDWTALVVQHEMAHVFQLDRTRGWWRVAQAVFGRNPVLFPNAYAPAWLTEGLAVYYESRFAAGGRLGSAYYASIARAAAAERALPPLGALSRASSRFPYGEGIYLYGASVARALAERGGPGSVRRFVERSSGDVIPFLLDRDARRAFGESFTRAWRELRDSAVRAAASHASHPGAGAAGPAVDAAPGAPAAGAGLRVAAGGARQTGFPRWIGDTAVLFASDPARETPGAYLLAVGGGDARRIARRNSLDANVPRLTTGAGGVVYSQAEFIDRFRVRDDLYRDDASGTHRLTHGARLSAPDVRRDGAIVAVQTVPGSTRLVRVSADGRAVVPLTVAAADTQWSVPRWSPDGSRIAGVRISRGANALVVLDTLDTLDTRETRDTRDTLDTIGAARVVVASPAPIRSVAWTGDGRTLVYSADRDGTTSVYAASADAEGTTPGAPVVAAPGGLYDVDVAPGGAGGVDGMVAIAASTVRADGYGIALWRGPIGGASGAPPPAADERSAGPALWDVVPDTSQARPYSPWRTLSPAYWSPLFSTGGLGGTSLGGLTSGFDVIGRHAYAAQALVNIGNGNVDAALSYQYARLANPVLSLSASQFWDYGQVIASGAPAGLLERRRRTVGARATIVRPRVRTFASATIGAELEDRSYVTDPAPLRGRLREFYGSAHRYPAILAGANFANTQRPARSISPEDGIAVGAAVRQRWETGVGDAGRSAVGVFTGYRSLDLGGFAHHVVAVRLTGGIADRRSPGDYSVGGVSGSALSVIPGLVVGDPARTFPVRGFPPGTEQGTRAVAGSVEYRAPLALVARGLGLLPLFLDRASIAAFADAGRATCVPGAASGCISSDTTPPTLASMGAELALDTALQYDVPYRLRLGMAFPVAGAGYARAPSVTAYVTLGAAF